MNQEYTTYQKFNKMVLSVQKSCSKDTFFNKVYSNIRKSNVIYDICMQKYETFKKNSMNFFFIFVVYDINKTNRSENDI